jgi:hypothetical protein
MAVEPTGWLACARGGGPLEWVEGMYNGGGGLARDGDFATLWPSEQAARGAIRTSIERRKMWLLAELGKDSDVCEADYYVVPVLAGVARKRQEGQS